MAMRPISLLIALAPVMLGTALGYRDSGTADLSLAALALLAALLMQLITNLQNDVGYTERGAEYQGQRIGLPRATALGWLTPRQVKVAIRALSCVAAALGCALFMLRGWPVLAMGAMSLLAALAYMGGPKPIAYTPWGELTVLVFFGPVAVLGTGWLLTSSLSAVGVLASIGMGSLAAAALAVNNHRDRDHDRLVGRKTFAVRFGVKPSQHLFTTLLVTPFVAVLGMAFLVASIWPLTGYLMTPLVVRLRRDFMSCPGGFSYNPILFRAFKLTLWFAVLLSLSAFVSTLST